jgi:hypothetical protein
MGEKGAALGLAPFFIRGYAGQADFWNLEVEVVK